MEKFENTSLPETQKQILERRLAEVEDAIARTRIEIDKNDKNMNEPGMSVLVDKTLHEMLRGHTEQRDKILDELSAYEK